MFIELFSQVLSVLTPVIVGAGSPPFIFIITALSPKELVVVEVSERPPKSAVALNSPAIKTFSLLSTNTL